MIDKIFVVRRNMNVAFYAEIGTVAGRHKRMDCILPLNPAEPPMGDHFYRFVFPNLYCIHDNHILSVSPSIPGRAVSSVICRDALAF